MSGAQMRFQVHAYAYAAGLLPEVQLSRVMPIAADPWRAGARET